VYAFLRQDVRKRLLNAGVIPASDGGNPGDDGDESVVNLSGSEWLKVLDDVRRAGPRARLTVKAARELRAADPVSLKFEVKSLPVPYPSSTASSR
ncbi:MAG TPA: hypothetical protein VM490_20605, partial [Armatimonadaceae bacterium]|nr:hypothetical protein [Armatimonadaceae bacterium]